MPLSWLHAPRAQTSRPGTRRRRVPLMQKYGNRRGGACQNGAYWHHWIVFSGAMLCADGPRGCASSRERCLLMGQRGDPPQHAPSLFVHDLTPGARSRPSSATVGARRHPHKLMKDAAQVSMARKAAIERDVNEGHRGVFQQFPRSFQLVLSAPLGGLFSSLTCQTLPQRRPHTPGLPVRAVLWPLPQPHPLLEDSRGTDHTAHA